MDLVCLDALHAFGRESQIRKAIEECLELALALTHYLDGKVPAASVVAEVADTNIMLIQLMMLPELNPDSGDTLWAEFNRKLDRLNERIIDKRNERKEHA
jgi:phosphoribosyl-ATP pyrophosphohydrolase